MQPIYFIFALSYYSLLEGRKKNQDSYASVEISPSGILGSPDWMMSLVAVIKVCLRLRAGRAH